MSDLGIPIGPRAHALRYRRKAEHGKLRGGRHGVPAARADATSPTGNQTHNSTAHEVSGRRRREPNRTNRRWKFVLNNQFLELRTRSVTEQDGKPVEVHEDVGFLSRDSERGAFVFRQFLPEGYVNTFEMGLEAEEPNVLLFDYREVEGAGGMRARMRLTFLTDGEYEMDLDLARPGKDFIPCQKINMRR